MSGVCAAAGGASGAWRTCCSCAICRRTHACFDKLRHVKFRPLNKLWALLQRQYCCPADTLLIHFYELAETARPCNERVGPLVSDPLRCSQCQLEARATL